MQIRHVAAGFASMVLPEGIRPDQLDLQSLKPLPRKREVGSGEKRLAKLPEGKYGVLSRAQSGGEKQEYQDRTAILPSYLNDILREGESRWLHPKKEPEVLRGWDSFAEYALDMAGLIHKPNTPSIPDNDIAALDNDNLNQYGMTADQWEEEVLSILDANEDRHLIPDFKRHMQEYRRSVKGIVKLWREEGLL